MTSADPPPRSHAPSKQDRQAGLDAKMVELHGAYNGFPLTLAHGHPDYALLQFAFDVWEQAGAVRLVTNGPSPRAAVANARAAFEASLDMYALVAEPSLYDEMGAFIRACELLAKEDLRKLRAIASQTLTLPVATDEEASPEDVMETEAMKWEGFQAGISVVCKRVIAQARRDQRWKYHWSGLGNYVNIAEYVERKHGAPAGFKEVATMWYRALTQESHPGARTATRSVSTEKPGFISFGPQQGDEALPLLIATIACEHAIDAIRLRRELIR